MRRHLALALLLVSTLTLVSCGGSFRRFLYAGPGRDGWQQPERVVEALALAPGAQVADLGAGGGYFTFRLADAVGPDGRVFAIDVDPSMLDYLRERVDSEGIANVKVVEAAYDDGRIPASGADLVFTVNTYHHISDRPVYFRQLAGSLRPGGRVAIIELDDGSWFRRWFGHYTTADTIRSEMESAGYRLAAEHDFLDRQSFLVFAAGS
jgi:FkbM family methyltransferase